MTAIRLQILYKFYWDRWIKMASSNKPSMNWNANDLNKEWKRFKQHCQFTFGRPLSDKTEKPKVNYLMTYIGDKVEKFMELLNLRQLLQKVKQRNKTR